MLNVNQTEQTGNRKTMERYFGNNLATVFYIISGFLIAAGLIGIFFRFYIIICAAVTIVGIILFFITIRMKITDKDYDEPLNKSADSYKKEHIENYSINRKPLDPETFDLFYGYLFDQPGIKRKVGKDGKMRSSRYYVTALHADRNGFVIFYSEYDNLDGHEEHRVIHAHTGDQVSVERPSEKPVFGDFRYTISVQSAEEAASLSVHLPDDALVDEKLSLIEAL